MKNYLMLFAGLCLLASNGLLAEDIFSQPYDIENIRYIETGNAVRLELRQGESESLSAEASADVLERVSVKVHGERLILGVNERAGGLFNWFRGRGDDQVRFVVQLKHLNGLELSGASQARLGNFEAEDLKVALSGASRVQAAELRFDSLALGLSGASRMEIERLQGDTLRAKISGASQLTITQPSDTEAVRLDVSGASRYAGEALNMHQAIVHASGASHAELGRSKTLEAKASGASNIRYRGAPELQQTLSGSSQIRATDD